MTVDPVSAIRTILLGNPALDVLVTGRVYRGELPSADNTAMPRAAVVVSPAGGGTIGRAYQDYSDVRIDTTCYGTTLHEAWSVHLACRDVLKQIDREVADQVLVHWARVLSDGALARDPVRQWPTCYASFRVLAATVAAS